MSDEQTGEAEAGEQVVLPSTWHKAEITVQCMRCAEMGRVNASPLVMVNSDPLDLDGAEDAYVVCQHCSKELGIEAIIPVTILVGQAVTRLFGEEPEEPTEDEHQDGS